MGTTATSRLGADSFAAITPALSDGARALGDPTAYLTAFTGALLTLVPAGLLWATAFAAGSRGEVGVSILALLLVYPLAVFGLFWIWMALGVRAASVKRGEATGVSTSLRLGARRLLTFAGAALLLVLGGVPLVILGLVTWLLAGEVVLSLVAIPFALVLVVGLFVWQLALLLVGGTLGAFSAADHRAGAVTVLARSVGVSLTNPALVALLLIAVTFVSLLMVGLLIGPATGAMSAGGWLVAYMWGNERAVSAALLAVALALASGALLLVPLLFTTSALASFAVGVEGDLDRIEEAGRRARSVVLEWLREARRRLASGRGPDGGPDGPPAGGSPPHSGPPPGGPPPAGNPPSPPSPPSAAGPASPHDIPVSEPSPSRPPAGPPASPAKPSASDDIDLSALPAPAPPQQRDPK